MVGCLLCGKWAGAQEVSDLEVFVDGLRQKLFKQVGVEFGTNLLGIGFEVISGVLRGGVDGVRQRKLVELGLVGIWDNCLLDEIFHVIDADSGCTVGVSACGSVAPGSDSFLFVGLSPGLFGVTKEAAQSFQIVEIAKAESFKLALEIVVFGGHSFAGVAFANAAIRFNQASLFADDGAINEAINKIRVNPGSEKTTVQLLPVSFLLGRHSAGVELG